MTLFSEIACLLKACWNNNIRIWWHFFSQISCSSKVGWKTTFRIRPHSFLEFLVCLKQFGNQLQNMVTVFSQIFCKLKSSWPLNLRIWAHFFLKFLGRWNQVGFPTWECSPTCFANFLFVKSKLGNQLERISNAIVYSKTSKKNGKYYYYSIYVSLFLSIY